MIKVSDRSHFLKVLKAFLPEKCRCAEIGVLYGDFSKLILDIIEPKNLILIDPYEISESKYGDENSLSTAYSTEDDYANLLERFKPEIYSGQVFVNRKYSYDAVDYCPDKFFDFIYHDGSHLYEHLKRDLVEWLPKVKEDGIICGHDYIENYKEYVCKAVDEFCAEYNFKMILFNENGGDFALKKI